MWHSGRHFLKNDTYFEIQGITMLASVWAHIRQQKGLNSEHQNNKTNQQIEVTYLMAHSGSTFKKDSASLNVEPLSGIHPCLKRVQDQTT